MHVPATSFGENVLGLGDKQLPDRTANRLGVTGQVVAGSQGWPSASMTKVSKKFRPCLAAVDR